MQVFIINSPLYTANALDKRRLNKQIIECRQILDAIKGRSQAWKNHPIVLSYKNYVAWLEYYLECLDNYYKGNIPDAKYYSRLADQIRPEFHTRAYFNKMKQRLYTKDSEYYSRWARFGTSDINMYYVDGQWLYYRNGKRIKS